MSLSKLNQKAISGKLRIFDYLSAAASIIAAIYFYYVEGMTTFTMFFIGASVLAVILAFVNPAKRVNNAMMKKQTGQK